MGAYDETQLRTSIDSATINEWDRVRNNLCPPSSIKKSPKDTQVGGEHYLNDHQPLYLVLDTEGFMSFRGACLTKIYKYLQRRKEDRTQDFKKARHVLDMLIEQQEKEDDKS